MNVETKYQELVTKKAKTEAQIEVFQAQIDEIKNGLQEKYGIDSFDELAELIQSKTDQYEKRKAEALAQQNEIMTELDGIIEAVKV